MLPIDIVLAWYMYPEPEGRIYTSTELSDVSIVEQVFDYCQILLAFIGKEGWQFLVNMHGIDRLLEINAKSGWFCNDTHQEAYEWLLYHCLISGYDPVNDCFGDYDEETGIFCAEAGNIYTVLFEHRFLAYQKLSDWERSD